MTNRIPTGDRPEGLRVGSVSATHLVFFVIAAAAPLTVLTGLTPLQFLVGGRTVPAGFLMAGAVYMVFAVGFTAMSRHIRNTGAFFAYITHGLGSRVGAGSAFVAYTSYTMGQIGFCAVAGLFATTTLRLLAGIELHWAVSALVIGFFVSVVSYLRVDAGARLLAVLLLAEVGILLVLMASILLQGVPEGYSFTSFDPGTWSFSSIGPLLVVTFIVFIGFEQTAVYSEEVTDPARTVPRATYTAVALLAAIYTVCSWLILMAAGPSALMAKLSTDPQNFVFMISSIYVGRAVTDVMMVLIVTSFTAGVLALHNASARYLFSLGRSGILPKGLSTTASTGSPTVAVTVQTVIVLGAITAFGMSALDPYTQVVVWTNTPTLLGVLALQVLTCLAVIGYFRRDHRGESVWHRIVAPTVSAIAIAIVMLLVCTQLHLLTMLGPMGNILISMPLIVAFLIGALRSPGVGREVLLNDQL
ncbi:APC family permease [Agrobacterium sp. P15N1-A]|uniref:APC family permease n=1 Tax=Agrobacterium sp. P15N1-A TaxID=3342820 RepID=UPI0037D93FC0